MPWREALAPAVMRRVAVLAPRTRLREVLAAVAEEGTAALDDVPAASGGAGQEPATPPGPATAALQRLRAGEQAQPLLAADGPDVPGWETAGRVDLIAGEAELERRSGEAVPRGRVDALTGWVPDGDLPALSDRVGRHGGVVVVLPRPAGSQPPTLLSRSGPARELAPLVETYATVPYADVNPSLLAGLAYVVMFGMMFADAGQGLLLLLGALAVRSGRWPRLEPLRPVWLFLAGAGVTSTVMGILYGEFFGPTGVLPVLWLAPLEHPVELLVAGVAAGAVLLAGAYALGTVNRVREGGWRRALYAPSGLAGGALFLGLGVLLAGLYLGAGWLAVTGTLLTTAGLATAWVGLYAAAGGGGGAAGVASVELVDVVVRTGTNVVSFARLAAFGLTHAALGAVVWEATTALAGHGAAGVVGAALVFLAGNAVTFALEGLVAAIQAMRLEYYELFSRVFDTVGEPFRPWHVPLESTEVRP